MKKLFILVFALISIVGTTMPNPANYKKGQRFQVPGIDPKIRPPLYLTNQQGQQVAILKDIRTPTSRGVPGIGVATYEALQDFSDTDIRKPGQPITTGQAALATAAQARAGTAGRTSIAGSYTARGQTARAQGQRIATTSQLPVVAGRRAPLPTPVAQPMVIPNVEEIVQPILPPAMKVAVPTGEYHKGTVPFLTTHNAPARPIGGVQIPGFEHGAGAVDFPLIEEHEKQVSEQRQAATEPIAIQAPQHATVEEEGGLEELESLERQEQLESAARKVKEATEKLRQQTGAIGRAAAQAPNKALLDAVNSGNINQVRSLLASGVRDADGQVLEIAESFVILDPEDQNMQQIVTILQENR